MEILPNLAPVDWLPPRNTDPGVHHLCTAAGKSEGRSDDPLIALVLTKCAQSFRNLQTMAQQTEKGNT